MFHAVMRSFPTQVYAVQTFLYGHVTNSLLALLPCHSKDRVGCDRVPDKSICPGVCLRVCVCMCVRMSCVAFL